LDIVGLILGSWPLENPSGKNWVDYIRNLKIHTPGQKAYSKFISSWEENDVKFKISLFFGLIAREYFLNSG